METTSKDLGVSRGAKMGIEKIDEQYTGGGYVLYCTEALGIKTTMLAGLLSITERTLSNWADTQITDDSQGKIDRLKTLYKIIGLAEGEGLRGKIILNVINEPIPGEQGDKSLLHYVVDEPNNSLLATVVRKVFDSYR